MKNGRSKVVVAAFVSVSGLLASPAYLGAAEPPASKQAVFKAVEAFATAFNAHDPKAAAMFDDKGVLVNARGERFEGRAAVEKDLKAGFAGPFKDAKLSVTADNVRMLTPEVAVQDDLFYMKNRKDAKGADVPSKLSHYAMVWVKRGDGWRIALLQAMIPAGQ